MGKKYPSPINSGLGEAGIIYFAFVEKLT